jgi:hypothetical protein
VTGDPDDDLNALTKNGYNQAWITTPVAIDIDREKTSALLKVARKLRRHDRSQTGRRTRTLIRLH